MQINEEANKLIEVERERYLLGYLTYVGVDLTQSSTPDNQPLIVRELKLLTSYALRYMEETKEKEKRLKK